MTDWHRIDDPENPPPMDGTKIIGAWRWGWWQYEVLVWSFGRWHPEFDNFAGRKPTHWMPLPPPPDDV